MRLATSYACDTRGREAQADAGAWPAPNAGEIRPIFLFHVPKTGGTSLFATFGAAVGPSRALAFIDVDPARIARRLPPALASGVLLFDSHITPLLVETPPHIIRTLAVREPADCLLSCFCFQYRQRHNHFDLYRFFTECPGYNQARFGLADILRWIDTFKIDNLQARVLSDRVRLGGVDGEHLAKARRALDACEIIGVTEDMAGYVGMLAAASGIVPEEMVIANRTGRDILDEDENVLKARLRPHVALDLALHEAAAERVARQARRSPPGARARFSQAVEPQRLRAWSERVQRVLRRSSAIEWRMRLAMNASRAANLARDFLRRVR